MMVFITGPTGPERSITMKTFHIEAQHTQGKSVSHCCTKGASADPVDLLPETIEADSVEDAELQAINLLESIVDDWTICPCGTKKPWLIPGNGSWWESVSIFAEDD
jgi:hypothetical protein